MRVKPNTTVYAGDARVVLGSGNSRGCHCMLLLHAFLGLEQLPLGDQLLLLHLCQLQLGSDQLLQPQAKASVHQASIAVMYEQCQHVHHRNHTCCLPYGYERAATKNQGSLLQQ